VHRKTRRDYLARMTGSKPQEMAVAKRYGREYWDGDRRYGYGGYRYDGRWAAVAGRLIEQYDLPADASVLDVGCGKAFLLYEFTNLLPAATVAGCDISTYAIEKARPEVKEYLHVRPAQERLPFADGQFDLVVSITTLHNLRIFELKAALREIERVGRRKFIVVESFRNDRELCNLQCWALTCAAFFSPPEWEWRFEEFGYTGDYEFIYFE
jgi:ubiquinone/menaquinone biosynthesis C-methylase UbiE